MTGQKNMAFNECILKANRKNCMRKMDATHYDETKPPAHSKFSILHELFHYESNHDLNAGEKNTELYNKQELEANFFAAEILMPEPVIKEIEKRGKKMDTKEIQKVFGTSAKAAEIRFKTLKSYPNFLRSNEEKEFDEYLVKFIFKKFSEFVCKFKIIRASHFFLDSPSLIYNFYCFNLKKMLQKNKMLLLEK